ncbi:MAG: hypothetical protein V7L11_22885 [Nostoc sp.]
MQRLYIQIHTSIQQHRWMKRSQAITPYSHLHQGLPTIVNPAQ